MTHTSRSPKDVFIELIGSVPPEGWESRLAEICQDDDKLHRQVRTLLDAHLQAGSFLESPAADENLTEHYARPLSERPGSIVGPYKLLQQIGEGGMGLVFMAEQSRPVQRTVALKIIKSGMDTPQVIARFEAERQALAMMDHPNIARVFDAGSTHSGRPFFVMELVKGVPITKYCDEKQLPLRDRLELMLPVFRAVQHAHQKGIIHRDIKPSNVLVAEYDDRAVPKVIDFGVAKATANRLTEKTMFTEFGQLIGTLEYMSPEQAKLNQLDVDTRSDIYSLGVLLYELLAGSTPFVRRQLQEAAFDEMLRIIREEDPPPPSTRLSTTHGLANIAASRGAEANKLSGLVKGELDWIVMKSLEKQRSRRYETAHDFAMDVERYLAGDAVFAAPPSAAYRLRKFVHRNRLQVIAGVLVFVALLAGIAGTSLGLFEARRQEQLAVQASEREGERADAEARERKRADEEKDRAARFLGRALDVLRATTDTDVEKLIGAKTELSANEREYLEAIARRWIEFATRTETDAESRILQAEGHFRVANLWQKLGRREEAVAEYQAARDASQSLIKQYPAVPQHRHDLATVHLNLGIQLAELGKLAEAPVEFQSALDLQTELATQFPDVIEYQGKLGVMRSNYGAFLVVQGKPDQAVVEFKAARDLQKKLVDRIPDDASYQQELAHTCGNLGVVLADLGKRDEALGEYRTARELHEGLVKKFPTVAAHQEGVADTHNRIGVLLVEQRRWKDARLEYLAALDLRKVLAQQFPAVPRHQIMLGGSYCNYGNLIRDEGNPADSLEWLNKAVQTLQPVHKQAPLDVTAQNFLRNSHIGRAQTYDLLKRYTEAVGEWTRAIELSPAAEQPIYQTSLAVSQLRAGMTAEAMKMVDELTKSENWNAVQWYNFACLYAIACKQPIEKKVEYADRAMDLLRRAVAGGFDQFDNIKTDSDLDALRGREDFKKLLDSLPK